MKGKSSEGRGSSRKKWTSAEKLRVVLAGMDASVDVSDVCRREGVNPSQYYSWKRQLLGSAEQIFSNKRAKPTAREERLTQALERAKDVIVEITTENLELKKTFTD